MRESYNLDRLLNVEFDVEYQMIFLTVAKICILTHLQDLGKIV